MNRLMDGEGLLKTIIDMIDDGDNERVKTLITTLREKDESASITYTIFLLEHLLKQDKFNEFEYWMDYTKFNIDEGDVNGFDKTLLMKMIDCYDINLNRVRHILNYTKNINSIDSFGCTALLKLSTRINNDDISDYKSVLKELLIHGAHPSPPNGESIFRPMCLLNKIEELEIVLRYSSYDIINDALYHSIVGDNYDFVELVLRFVKDINAHIRGGSTPMEIAQDVKFPNADIIELLRGSL